MMTPSAMANFIIGQIQGIDKPENALSTFYSALCSYVQANMQVLYGWVATMPPPASTPDPTVLLDCKVMTTGSLSLSYADKPDSALANFAQQLNSQVSLWQVIWPAGFSISPAFIMPTITFSQSGATDMNSAWLHICTEIINGLKAATPVGSGIHGPYTVGGVASFTQIL